MGTFVIWALGIVLAVLIFGFVMENLGFALGASAVAGLGLFRFLRGAWRAGRNTTERVEFLVMAVIVVFGVASFIILFVRWLFT